MSVMRRPTSSLTSTPGGAIAAPFTSITIPSRLTANRAVWLLVMTSSSWERSRRDSISSPAMLSRSRFHRSSHAAPKIATANVT